MMCVSGWTKFEGCGDYIDVHPETGKWTYGGAIPYCRCDNPKHFYVNVGLGKCESCGNRTISFEGKNFDECNDEWLVTWFNYGSNTAYTILNDSSIFEVKNVDDCKRVVTTKNNSIYPLLYNQDEIFVHSSYTDCGVPKLIDSPLTAICKTKYSTSTTQQNSGHKVKYKPINSRIPSGCITNNQYLTEIYFPSYLDDTNYKNTRTIGASAFSNNNRLSAITLGVVSKIEENAFVNCRDLSLIDWGYCSQSGDSFHRSSELGEIEKSAFRNCNSLNYVNLPNTLKKIGESAFGRTMLNAAESCLYIPTSLDKIGERAFTEINPKCIVWNISDDGLLKDGLLPKNDVTSDYNPVFSFNGSPIYVYLPNLKTESSFNIINKIIGGSFPSGSKIYVGMSDEDIQNLPSGEHYFSFNTTVLNKSHWTEDGFSTSWPYDNPS